MDVQEILRRHCGREYLYEICFVHGQDVAGMAVELAEKLGKEVDLEFLWEATILHDIGIVQTFRPELGCFGRLPYFCHGFLGAEILRQEGLPRHANVCERHVGTGWSLADVQRKNRKLPSDFQFPERDMRPQTLEEALICFTDCFFSKSNPGVRRSILQMKHKIYISQRYDRIQFEIWLREFMPDHE